MPMTVGGAVLTVNRPPLRNGLYMRPIDMTQTLRAAAFGASAEEVSKFAQALRQSWASARIPAEAGTMETAFNELLDNLSPDEEFPFLFPKEWLGWRLGREFVESAECSANPGAPEVPRQPTF